MSSGISSSTAEILHTWYDFRSRGWSSPGTAANHRLLLAGWVPIIGGILIGAIGPLDVQRLYLARDDRKRSGAWLNKERDTLHAFFAWAVGLGLLSVNPVTSASWPHLDPKKRRSLRSRVFVLIDPPMLQRILDACPARYHRLLVFLFLTALRISEALAARRSWIRADPRDPDQLILAIPDDAPKQRRGYVVPLSGRVRSLLGMLPEGDGRLFAEIGSASTVRHILQRAGKRIGIERLSPHQFRRSCATALCNAGMPLPAVQRFVGWKAAPRDWLQMFEESYYLGLEGSRIRGIQEGLWPIQP
jgi:integrase